MVDDVAGLIDDLLRVEPEVAGIGVAAAGFIDAERSTVLYAISALLMLKKRLIEDSHFVNVVFSSIL